MFLSQDCTVCTSFVCFVFLCLLHSQFQCVINMCWDEIKLALSCEIHAVYRKKLSVKNSNWQYSFKDFIKVGYSDCPFSQTFGQLFDRGDHSRSFSLSHLRSYKYYTTGVHLCSLTIICLYFKSTAFMIKTSLLEVCFIKSLIPIHVFLFSYFVARAVITNSITITLSGEQEHQLLCLQ